MTGFVIRAAGAADIAELRAMQLRSMRALGGAFYATDVLATSVATFGTMDFSVIAEGHFFVAVAPDGGLVGSGGWSQQPPGYGRGDGAKAVAADIATVRGVFSDPAVARRGVGRAMMRHVETDAFRHGVTRLTLTATLSGVALYEALGYRCVRRRAIPLEGGLEFGCVDMDKELPRERFADGVPDRVGTSRDSAETVAGNARATLSAAAAPESGGSRDGAAHRSTDSLMALPPGSKVRGPARRVAGASAR